MPSKSREPVKVELSEEADEQVREIDAWWREHRRAAPDLFTDELDRMLLALGEMPTLGTRYGAGTRTVQRLPLRRTHYQQAKAGQLIDGNEVIMRNAILSCIGSENGGMSIPFGSTGCLLIPSVAAGSRHNDGAWDKAQFLGIFLTAAPTPQPSA